MSLFENILYLLFFLYESLDTNFYVFKVEKCV